MVFVLYKQMKAKKSWTLEQYTTQIDGWNKKKQAKLLLIDWSIGARRKPDTIDLVAPIFYNPSVKEIGTSINLRSGLLT